MNLDFISSATAKELQQFKSVCNQLLSRTFVVRTLYRPGRERLNNPDYTFLSIHFEAVRDYLSLLDWDLRHDEANGCFYVINTDEANRLILSKRETAILLALRMLYDESQERLGLEQDALCTVREVLEKVVTDYAILRQSRTWMNSGARCSCSRTTPSSSVSKADTIRRTAALPFCRPF